MAQLLTVLLGDHVRHVDLPVAGFGPHAASGRALVGIPLVLIVIGDVVHDEGLVLRVH